MDAALPLVESLVEVFQASVGSTVSELDDAVREVTDGESDRLRVGGFVKLLRDRCDIETLEGVDPVDVRAEVFGMASQVRQALGLRDVFDSNEVIERCALARGVPSDRLREMLFADLPGAQTLRSVRPISAADLLQRYNLALAQGVLLRAVRVTIELAPTTAPRIRQLLRAIKFRRLMYRIGGTSEDGYEIELDGPMSLFESTQRYGIQLALFLPVLVAGEGWSLKARVRWGKRREESVFSLSERDGLVSYYREEANELEEIEQLRDSFSRLGSSWTVRRSSRVFHIKGITIFVPDLVFEKKGSKQRVYLEAFGYWNREAVFDRVEALQQGLGERFLLAVSKKLRVSPAIADERFPGRILVYSGTIGAHTVCRMLDDMAEQGLL